MKSLDQKIDSLARQVRLLAREICELRTAKMLEHPEALPVLKSQAMKIVQAVCQAYGILPEDVFSRRRTCTIAEARQVAMVLLRETTSMTTGEIGLIFGRDHGTVLYACEVISGYRSVHPQFAERYQHILNDVTPSPRETFPKGKEPRLMLLTRAA